LGVVTDTVSTICSLGSGVDVLAAMVTVGAAPPLWQLLQLGGVLPRKIVLGAP
jgi:hypothetical protein